MEPVGTQTDPLRWCCSTRGVAHPGLRWCCTRGVGKGQEFGTCREYSGHETVDRLGRDHRFAGAGRRLHRGPVGDHRECAVGHGQHRRLTTERQTRQSECHRSDLTDRPSDGCHPDAESRAEQEARSHLGAGADREGLQRRQAEARSGDQPHRRLHEPDRHLPQREAHGLRRDAGARRQGPVPGAGPQPRLHQPGHLLPRSGDAARARLPGPPGIRRLPHRLPRARLRRRRSRCRLRAAAAVRGRHDQRRLRGEAFEAGASWTATGSAGWGGRWAATSR